jgi:predicted nucleic acid-binding protein
LDKDWSVTDCASFVIMDHRRIVEALTHDHHFEQKGYRALLRESA